MIKVAMLDDEKTSLSLGAGAFSAAFKSAGIPAQISTFESADALFFALEETNFDLFCLDIILGNEHNPSGIDVAKRIRTQHEEVPICFISSNETKVFSCFDVNPIGFIRKTNFLEDSNTLIQHYIKDIMPRRENSFRLEIKSKGETSFVEINKIVYIEGDHNYQKVFVVEKEEPYLIRELISTLEKQLIPYDFIRVHKGFLVNAKYIQKFATNYLVLKTGQNIPISRARRNEFLEIYMEMTRNTLI